MFTSIRFLIISTLAATVLAQGGRGGGRGGRYPGNGHGRNHGAGGHGHRPWGGHGGPDPFFGPKSAATGSPFNTGPANFPFDDQFQTRCPTVYTTATDGVCSTCAEPDCTLITTITPDCACGTAIPTVTAEYPCEGRCPRCAISYVFPTETADCEADEEEEEEEEEEED
ncbi:uncharacterized protein DNG_08221 [Cephalotrichum gorgonifer]|uniref:Uncharacterized protein n=1 Tax=Cephalotrichum gorgonifer TaxID=2041049 RepID=A0AAE8SY68_9PEZI|nr:uncharacterized protein DNG_08221 [Cephalotrichum gorgonifer]